MLKLVKPKNSTEFNKKIKRIKESDGFAAITIKRNGMDASGGLVRHSITDEEIIYWLESIKKRILNGED